MTPLIHSDKVRRFLTPLLALSVALPAFAQMANPKDDKGKDPAAAAPDKKDEVLQLSPFSVSTTKDTGYFAQNTLAGSRMKTNLADLGAAISVVTKAQMEDFASVDLNDVFRYELNTEGSGTYTPATQAFRNDGVLDVNDTDAVFELLALRAGCAGRARGGGADQCGLDRGGAQGRSGG